MKEKQTSKNPEDRYAIGELRTYALYVCGEGRTATHVQMCATTCKHAEAQKTGDTYCTQGSKKTQRYAVSLILADCPIQGSLRKRMDADSCHNSGFTILFAKAMI